MAIFMMASGSDVSCISHGDSDALCTTAVVSVMKTRLKVPMIGSNDRLKGLSHILDVAIPKTFSPDKSVGKKFFKLQHLRCGTGPLLESVRILALSNRFFPTGKVTGVMIHESVNSLKY